MAFYPDRKFNKCIFCLRDKDKLNEAGLDLTKEHFFGDSIKKRIQTVGNYSTANVRGGSPMSHITLKALCLHCNNKILGKKIMTPVTKIIADLYEGKSKSIEKANIALVKNYFVRMAMMIDIASSNYDVETGEIEKLSRVADSLLVKFDPIISDDERKKFIDNIETPSKPVDAPRVSVMLGHFSGAGGEEGQVNIRFFPGQREIEQGTAPFRKEFVMVYHRLAFVLVIGDQNPPSFPGFRYLPDSCFEDQFDLYSVNAAVLNEIIPRPDPA